METNDQNLSNENQNPSSGSSEKGAEAGAQSGLIAEAPRPALLKLNRSLMALRLEVDKSIADDVSRNAYDAVTEGMLAEKARILEALDAERVGNKFPTDAVWNRALEFARRIVQAGEVGP